MASTNLKIYIALFGLLCAFGGGFFVAKNYYSKPLQVVTVTKIDTFTNYVPVYHDVTTKPINSVINKPFTTEKKQNNQITQVGKMVEPNNYYINLDSILKTNTTNETFSATDTTHFDSYTIANSYVGNCTGIISHNTKILGSLPIRYIVKRETNTITLKPNLFALYGGFKVGNIDNPSFKNIEPMAILSIKQKYLLGYSFNYSTKQNNGNFLIKLK